MLGTNIATKAGWEDVSPQAWLLAMTSITGWHLFLS